MKETSDATVLVVEDEQDLAEVYADFLSIEYDVRVATDGDEAFEKIDEAVDVALLDRRMPGMSGDEVLIELRQRDFDCQVAMLTAVEPDRDIVDMPFDDYKIKPVSQADLLGLVEVLLERRSYSRRSRELFSLASKKAALEIADNDDTEEYEQLVERMDEIRDEIDTTLDKVGAEAAFKELSSGTV